MGEIATDIARVSESVRRNEVRRLVYVHCDHFEPWVGGHITEANVERVLAFAEAVSRVEHGRRLSLFYLCANPMVASHVEGARAVEGDGIGFLPPGEDALARSSVVLRDLVARGHEIGVHYHHEFFTDNPVHSQVIPELRHTRGAAISPEHERARWRLGLRSALETTRRETGLPLERWAFVHGNWALAASDPQICTIVDELRLLMDAGCVADFTFPAAYPHPGPRFTEPSAVLPVAGRFAYDLPAADPRPAFGTPWPDRLFIWASPITARGSSIDYSARYVRDRLESPLEWALELVNQSFTRDGILFVKTHAHSMLPDHFAPRGTCIPPLLHPGIQRLLGTLFDGAVAAGAELEFTTALEVYDRYFGGGGLSPGAQAPRPH